MQIGQTEISSGISIGELFVIEPNQFQDCGVKIMDVDRLFNGFKAKFIGCPVNIAALHSATGHPGCEPPMVVVATIDLASV